MTVEALRPWPIGAAERAAGFWNNQDQRGRNSGLLNVGSKLKGPLFVAREMSGFIINQQQSGLWESGNPAVFAGFPSEVGKSVFGLFHLASFPPPFRAAFCRRPRSHLGSCIDPIDAVRGSG